MYQNEGKKKTVYLADVKNYSFQFFFLEYFWNVHNDIIQNVHIESAFDYLSWQRWIQIFSPGGMSVAPGGRLYFYAIESTKS